MKKFLTLAALGAAFVVPQTAHATTWGDIDTPSKAAAFQRTHALLVDGIVGRQTWYCAFRNVCRGIAPGPLGGVIHRGRVYYGHSSRRVDVCHDGILSNDAGHGCADSYSVNTASGTGSVPSGGAAPPQSVAQCESGGDPTTNTGNGFYGKWQFTDATWHAVTGLPGHASDYSEAVQDAAAAKLWDNGQGAGNWPVCSHR
jgi:Transglycosylase-like domain